MAINNFLFMCSCVFGLHVKYDLIEKAVIYYKNKSSSRSSSVYDLENENTKLQKAPNALVLLSNLLKETGLKVKWENRQTVLLSTLQVSSLSFTTLCLTLSRCLNLILLILSKCHMTLTSAFISRIMQFWHFARSYGALS